MKKTFSLAVLCAALFGAARLVSAGTTNIYVEDWGTTNGATGANSLPSVGWTINAVISGSGAYNGIYGQTGANDVTSGNPLPANTVYFTGESPGQSGIFYTTNGAGAGGNGDSAFTSIDPTQFSNLTFSIEAQNPNSSGASNFFAILEGGTWYISTNALVPFAGGGASFMNASTPYTNQASAWNLLTINPTSVTIGATPSANLSGPITGIGVVETSTGAAFSGWNYNELVVSVFSSGATTNPATLPSVLSPPISQTAFVGAGASFALLAGGTPTLTYYWQANGVTLANGGRISGATSNVLTITNLNANDASATYSVIVSNSAGSVTNTGFTLTVNSAPSSYLYAETFPYVGPAAVGNEPVSDVGWVSAIPDGLTRIFQNGGGAGSVYAYEATAMTTAFYTTTTNDTGASGLPFPTINPANYPAVSFEILLDANSVATDVTAYFAVQMNSDAWYVASTPIPENITTTGIYETNALQFNSAASNWDTLTITGGGTGAAIGSEASAPLAGNITGAGVVFIHAGAGGDFNFDEFLVTTNPSLGTPPAIGLNGAPNSQSVLSGGGVSFGVATTGGTGPFTYGWTMNGTKLVNGGRISGATNATVTIADVTDADSGASIVAFVTNAAGFDESDNYTTTTLTVSDPPVGTLYSETFPFVGPLAGNYPIGSAGWAEAVSGSPFTLFQNLGSDGAVFAYFGTPATNVYYTDTLTDTNQAGLPFPNINVQSYPDLTLSVDIAPSSTPANVTAYFAVQMDGGAWYAAASPLPVPTGSATGTFSTYTMPFNAAAANWNHLTISGTTATVGAPASANLRGIMTGVGAVFVTVSTGGNFNFDNVLITGSGLGGVNVTSSGNGSATLSWVGNPAVNLQSTTSLTAPNWQDVPNTLGLYWLPVTPTGSQKYFRLVQH